MGSKQVDASAFEGRGNDGNYYAIGLKDGSVVRLGDHDGPDAVVARWISAKKANDPITFSGARAEPNGKLDGFGVYLAGDVVSIRNFGSSALGVAETRIAALEGALQEIASAVNEVREDADEIIDVLIERGLMDAKDWEAEDAPSGQASSPAQAAALAQPGAPSADVIEAMRSVDDEDEG